LPIRDRASIGRTAQCRRYRSTMPQAPSCRQCPRPLSRAELEGDTLGFWPEAIRARLAIVSRPASSKPSIRTVRGTVASPAHPRVEGDELGMRKTPAAPTPEQSAEREGARYEPLDQDGGTQAAIISSCVIGAGAGRGIGRAAFGALRG
jgi:hypothetical protein